MKRKKGRQDRGPRVAVSAENAPKVSAPEVTVPGTHECDTTIATDAAFWRPLLLAVETEPLGIQHLRGVSGLSHKLIDVGIDKARDRIVLLTDSADPKIAAFIQSDLQQAYPRQKVVAARAVLVAVAPSIKQLAGSPFLSSLSAVTLAGAFQGVRKDETERVLRPAFEALMGDPRLRSHSPVAFIHQLLTEIVALDWTSVEGMSPQSSFGPLLTAWSAGVSDGIDDQLGICPLPLFRMTADEVENVKLSTSLDLARELLVRHGVWEYFFPRAADLTLGLVDRGVATVAEIDKGISLAPERGHPLAEPERPSIEEVVDELKRQGFVVEGEFGLETTVAGVETRALVKFKPKESLLVKLANMLPLAALFKHFLK